MYDAGKPHGMLSIVGLEDRTIETLCREALEGCPAGTVCQLANYLFPQVSLITGSFSFTTALCWGPGRKRGRVGGQLRGNGSVQYMQTAVTVMGPVPAFSNSSMYVNVAELCIVVTLPLTVQFPSA